MPLLAVMRHAKSAYPEGVVDHDRPLSARGVADAKVAGEWLREHLGVPDHVVVSTARRARGTWTVAAGPLGYIGAAGYDAVSPGPLTVDPRVYEAPGVRLLSVVRELPERVATAVLVGHLPGVGELVGLLAGSWDADAAERLADKYATCGIAVLELPGPWAALDAGTAHLRSFAVPRAAGD